MLILGPAGIGKTALVLKFLGELQPGSRSSFLYVGQSSGLHDLVRSLVQKLFESRDPSLRAQLRSEGIHSGAFKGWLDAQSSSRLKGSLYRAADSGNFWIFLDHVQVYSEAVAHVVEELVQMRNTPVYLLTRKTASDEGGRLAKIYWSNQQRITLRPLGRPDSAKLFDLCAGRFRHIKMNFHELRPEILRLSGGVPGAIVSMCELASRPRYQIGSRIKSNLIRIDYLMRGEKPGRVPRGYRAARGPLRSG